VPIDYTLREIDIAVKNTTHTKKISYKIAHFDSPLLELDL